MFNKKLILILTLSLILIYAAGMFTVNAEDEVTLELLVPMYSDKTEPFWEDLIERFENENPNIEIKFEIANWDGYASKVQTRVSTGQTPDLINLSSYQSYLNDGLLLDLNKYLSEDFMDKFVPGFLEPGKRGDSQYSLPIATSIRALFYNPELFAEAGIKEPPETWSDLREACEKLAESNPNIYPFAYEMSKFEGHRFLDYYFWGAGGAWKEDGEWVINSPENVEAIEFFTQLTEDDLTNPAPPSTDRDELQQVFATNRVGMLITASFFPIILDSINPDMEFEVGPIPVKEGEEQFTLGIADTIVAFERSEHPEEVAKFLEFLYQDDNYYEFCSAEGMLPGTKPVGEMMSKDSDLMAQFIEMQQNARTEPTDPYLRRAWNITTDNVADVILGNMTAEEALDKAQSDLLKEIE